MQLKRSPFGRALACVAGVLITVVSTGVQAQSPAQDNESVHEVRLVGVEGESAETLRVLITTAVGQPFDVSQVAADRRRLLGSGAVLDVQTDSERTAQGVVVTFRVQPRVLVREIRFVGNLTLDAGELRAMVPSSIGDPLDLFAARQGRQAILDRYRKAGHDSVVVVLDAERARDGDLVYRIEEGPQVRIHEIVFEGRQAFSDAILKRHVESVAAMWIIRDGHFDVDTVERDAAAVQKFYRREGFLDARVSYRLEFDESRANLTLVFVISEATRYRIESVTFEGNTVYSDDELRSMMTLAPNDFFRKLTLERDLRTLLTRYHDNGYIYAAIAMPTPVFSEIEGIVTLTLRIVEDQQIRVGRVVVRGNETTKDKVVRRALKLLPGDVFNLSEAGKTEQRLVRTQIFSQATVTPVGNIPGLRDVRINVEEASQAGDFIFAAGVTSNNGLVGSIVLDIKNFDLFDRPRSFSELIKLRSFHGAGQRMRIEAQPGTRLSRFRIDFTEPYLMDLPINFGASLYLFTRGREGYDEGHRGGNISFGRKFTGPWVQGWPGLDHLRDWSGELSLRIEEATVDNLDMFTARRIRDDEGSHLITSVKLGLALDRTDSRMFPTEGDAIRLSWEQFGALGGDQFFGKLTGRYTWHHTVRIDEQERKSVLSLRANVGAIVGDVPVFERFYAGGIGTLRGFGFRGVSPRKGLSDDAVGGDFMLLSGVEYSFPLYSDTVRGVVFSDMGTVEESFRLSSWRASVGVGVRVVIKPLGSLPMEFNLAVPISSDEDDRQQLFSFLLGVGSF